MSDVELTTALRALDARLEETPDLVGAVAARLDAGPPVAGAAPRYRSLRLLLVAVAVLLALAATAIASSHSVRHWLLDRGVDAREASSLPDVDHGALSDLGVSIEPAEAAAAVGQPLPRSRLLGVPSAIRRAEGAREVTLAWAARPDYPESRSFPGVGALLTMWPERLDHEPFVVAKVLAPTSEVQFVTLPDGAPAVWIEGAPHAVRVFNRGAVRFRMAANVLIWTTKGLNFRLETNAPLDRTVELAASFTPGR